MFLERDINPSYLSDLTRFQHRMKLQPAADVGADPNSFVLLVSILFSTTPSHPYIGGWYR